MEFCLKQSLYSKKNKRNIHLAISSNNKMKNLKVFRNIKIILLSYKVFIYVIKKMFSQKYSLQGK